MTNEDNNARIKRDEALSKIRDSLPKDLFRNPQNREVSVDKELSKSLQLRAGKETLKHFTKCMVKLQETEPCFAMAAAADAILALEALIKSHTNADEETLEICCGTFGVALFNAGTTHTASIVECSDDETIFDHTPSTHMEQNND